MDSVLCELLTVSSKVIKTVIELGEFILRGPIRNAHGWQGKGGGGGFGGPGSLPAGLIGLGG